MAELKVELEALDSPVVFCHNDLLSANIIKQDNSVQFIDYEYGCYNYRGFDIGNHFNEWAGFECDYSKYPSKAVQMVWIRHYLKAFYNNEPSAIEVDQVYKEANKFALASHFYWGLWGLVQAELSNIDFDYMEYAIMRFKEYYAKKKIFLAL